MPELIRESSHENQISIIYLRNERVYRKISRTDSGRLLLKNEGEGIKWYGDKNGDDEFLLTCTSWDTKTFTRLDVNSISGVQVMYINSIIYTFPFLESCLEHYCSLWPNEDVVPCHGDLTLDNVIFTEQREPVFFDWEHFYEDGECWGFDMAYLILSAVVMPKPGFTKFKPKEADLFLNLWDKLCKKGLHSDLAVNPVSYFQNSFQSKKHWQNILGNSPNKLFPMWMNNTQEECIYKLIKNGC